MKFHRLLATVSAVALVTVGGLAASALRQDMPQPTESHRWLLSHVGTWDAKIEMMGEVTSGTWTVEKGPGGLWIVSDFKGTVMGGPFHGMEFMGFDPETEEFTSTWIDSMTPRATTMTGTYDKAAKTLTAKGEMMGMDGAMHPAVNVTTYPDADHMMFEMKATGPDGSLATMMTIEYTRKK